MAERFYTAASGNWSTTANWDGGVALPTSSDDVYANGKAVTIDQDITVLSLRTTAGATAVAGGSFTTSTAGRSITLTGAGVVPGSTSCLAVSNTTGTTTLAAAVAGSATTNSAVGVAKSGAGTLALTGNVTGGNGTNRIGLTASAGTTTVTGSVTGGSTVQGMSVTSTAVVTVTGSVTGGTGLAGHGILYSGSGTLTITGNLTGGSNAGAAGVSHSSGAGTLVVNGDLIPATGNAYFPGTSLTGRLHLNGNIQGVSTGVAAVGGGGGSVFTIESTGALTHTYRGAVGAGAVGSARSLSTGADYPAASAVLSTVTYNNGLTTGTYVVVATSDVRSGVTFGAASALTGTYTAAGSGARLVGPSALVTPGGY